MKFRLIAACMSLYLSMTLTNVCAESSCDTGTDPLCGPQSLLSICESMGVKTNLNELKELSGFDEAAGTTLLGLERAAEAKGLYAVGVKIGAGQLAELGSPAIAHLWGGHFVEVKGAGPDALVVVDPPSERRIVPLEEFKKSFSGFALLISKDPNSFPKSEADGPDLRLDSYAWDFGPIEQGAAAFHTFKLMNVGNRDLVITGTRATCSCTSALVAQDTISPGKTGEAIVTFDSNGRQGGQSQIVYLESNDPISPVVQLRIGGLVRPDHVLLSSRSVDFGSPAKGSRATREIHVMDPGDGSVEVTGVTSDSPYVTVSLAQERNDERHGYLVTAIVEANTPVGRVDGNITVSTNHPKEPTVNIPVSVTVKGDIAAFPDMFFLGLLNKGQRAEKTISVSTAGKEPLVIKNVETSFAYLSVDIKTEVEGKKYALTAKLNGKSPTGCLKGDVIIHTNYADQPEIKVPVYALVEHK